jgi:hypothetical protein
LLVRLLTPSELSRALFVSRIPKGMVCRKKMR